MELKVLNINNNYLVKLGKFDQKRGPICLNAEKGRYCHFRDKECKGINCLLMVDAINFKEDNAIFKSNSNFYHVIKVKINNPSKRGNVERYVIVVKISKRLGLLKQDVLEELKIKFINFIQQNDLELTMDDAEQCIHNFEGFLENNLNATQDADEMHFLREKLNVISMNLQLILAELEELPKEHIRKSITESLTNLFEIVSFYNKKSKND